MSIQIIDCAGNVLGTMQLPASTRLVDLEAMRRLGAHRIEVINEISKARP